MNEQTKIRRRSYLFGATFTATGTLSLGLPLLGTLLLAASPAAAEAADSKVIPEFKRIVIDENPPRQPWYKMVGDVTGDGHLEIVVAGRAGPIVMYSRPDWEKTVIAKGGHDGGVRGSLADINGNGRLDLLMGNVVWLENPGQAGGEWRVHRIDRQGIHDVLAADLTGNGRLDVVGRDQSAFGGRGNAIYIYYQQEPNVWKKEVIECPHGEGIALADVDGDGRTDIIINSIWYRNEPGNWTPHVFAPDWTHPDAKVETGDINGNGRADIVLTPAELRGQRYRISWFESPAGDKTAPWKEHVIVPDIECVVHALALGDFNNNGALDVAYAEMHQGQDPDEVVVMFNFENGTRWEKRVIDEAGSHDIVAGDLNGNGALDIAGANHDGVHPVVIWENQLISSPSASALPASRNRPAPSRARTGSLPLDKWQRHLIDPQLPHRSMFVAAADLDGDGHKDIVTGAWWYRNPGSPGGKWERREIGSPLYNMAAVYDFDGDGHPDILGTQGKGASANAEFVWARNDGKGNFEILGNIPKADGDFLQGVAVARFQKDGPLEVALSWHVADKGIQMLTVPENPLTEKWGWRRVSEHSQDEDLSVADLTGNGHLDLFLGTQWLENPGAAGGHWKLHTIGSVTQGLPDRNRLFDFNGNGRLDAVVGLENGTDVLLFLAPPDPRRPWERRIIGRNVGGGFSMDAGDLNGNGFIDVVLGEHRGKPHNRVIIYENVDGAGQWREHVIDSGEGEPIDHHDGTILVDIDGDGDLDIISIGWYHPKLWLYENKAID